MGESGLDAKHGQEDRSGRGTADMTRNTDKRMEANGFAKILCGAGWRLCVDRFFDARAQRVFAWLAVETRML